MKKSPVLFLLTFVFILSLVNGTNAGWYDPEWSYRRPVFIDNTQNGDTLHDFQVRVTLPYFVGMQGDFDDIRYTSDDSITSIPYWIEEYVNTNYAITWVKVPIILPLDTTRIFLYYGNPNAVSESDGEAVFDFFDDFNDQDISDWTILNGTWTAQDSFLEQLLDPPTRRKIISSYSISEASIIENKMVYLSSGAYSGNHIFLSKNYLPDNSDGYKTGFAGLNTGGSHICRMDNEAVIVLVSDNTIYNLNYAYTWLRLKTIYDGQGYYAMNLRAPDSVQVNLFITDNTYQPPFMLAAWVGAHIGIDDLRVRKYTDPEPGTSIGEEQIPEEIVIEPNHSDSTNTGQTITYSIYAENRGSTKDVVEILKQWMQTKWQVTIRDSLTGDTLVDHNGNGIPDIDTLHLNETRYLFIDIIPTDSCFAGTTDTTVVKAYFAGDTTVSDTCFIITKIITDVSLTINPDQSGNILPGESINYSLDITNYGNIKDVVDVTVDQSIPSWSCDLFDSTGAPLVDHNGNWVVDIDTLYPFGTTCDIAARIISPASANPGDIDTTRILVRFTSYPSLVDTAILITTVQAAPSNIIIQPDYFDSTYTGQLKTYPIYVENQGMTEDIVEISKQWTLPDWNVAVRDSLTGDTLVDHNGNGIPDIDTLRAYEIRYLLVDVMPDDSAYAGTIDTSIIKAYFASDTIISDTCFCITKISTHVSLNIVPDQSSNVFPGAAISYFLNIANTGNIKDVVDVIEIQNTPGWSFDLLDSTGTPLVDHNGNWIPDIDTLDGFGGICDISSRISAPATANPGDIDTTRILVRFSGYPSHVDTATLITTVIAPGSTAVLIEPDQVGYVDPDSTISYGLTVWNLSAIDDVIDIVPSGTTPNWLCSLYDSLGNPLVDSDGDGIVDIGNVPPDGEVPITAGIKAPSAAQGSERDSTTLWAISSNDTLVRDDALLVSIVSVSSSVIIEPSATGFCDPGSTFTYNLFVANLGNSSDVIDIENTGTSPNWNLALMDSSGNGLVDSDGDGMVDLGIVQSGDTVPIQAAVTVPPTAQGSERDSTTLWAISSNDTTVHDDALLVTIVNTSVAVLIEPDCSDSALPRDTVVYNLTVSNLGNSNDVIDITSSGGIASWYFEITDMNGIPLQDTDNDGCPDVGVVPPGGSVPIQALVASPDSALAGETDTRIVFATSSLNQNIYDTATLATTTIGSITLFLVDPNYHQELNFGTSHNYSIVARLEGTVGDFVEISPHGSSNGWTYELLDHLFSPLADTNANGLLELGMIEPGQSINFYLRVHPPSSMTAIDSLALRVIVTGETDRFTMVDSAIVHSYIIPILDIHNYESPFSSRTTFRFSIPAAGVVYLDVYNRLGEKVRTLISGRHYQRGIHTLPWDGRNDYGRLLAPAVYYYVFRLIKDTGDEDKIIKKTAIVK